MQIINIIVQQMLPFIFFVWSKNLLQQGVSEESDKDLWGEDGSTFQFSYKHLTRFLWTIYNVWSELGGTKRNKILNPTILTI